VSVFALSMLSYNNMML